MCECTDVRMYECKRTYDMHVHVRGCRAAWARTLMRMNNEQTAASRHLANRQSPGRDSAAAAVEGRPQRLSVSALTDDALDLHRTHTHTHAHTRTRTRTYIHTRTRAYAYLRSSSSTRTRFRKYRTENLFCTFL
eukprot:GHVU01200991.1.p1 GENE.GHVU01200991.1~~GHVU01200991.1.p1  ORF type:complete len:134 (-),score=6.29 GHVU01200991.1:102-503(-)